MSDPTSPCALRIRRNPDSFIGRHWTWAFLASIFLTLLPSHYLTAEDEVDDAVMLAARQKVVARFDRFVFGERAAQSIESVQVRFHRILKQKIDTIDRSCQLTDIQKQKLELAGRGTVRQYMQNVDEFKHAYLLLKDEPDREQFLGQEPHLKALQMKVRTGPFDEESLLSKSIRTVLTAEQAAKFDQRLTLALTSNKAITVANACELVRIAKLPKGVFQIVGSPDGKRFGLVEFNKYVDIYLPHEDQAIRRIGEGKKVVGFDFSLDENIVGIAENSPNAVIINLREQKEIVLQTGQIQPTVKFSPDGKTIATGGYGAHATLWSVATGELVRKFDVGPREGGLTPVFSPDGTVLAVGHRNSSTRLFDVASGRLLQTLNRDMTQGLSFDSTGKTLAVTYVDGSLALWDVKTGKLKQHVQTQADELYSVDWSPDSSLLVTSGRHALVTVWNPEDLSILSELDCPGWVISARFSSNGQRLLFAGGPDSLGEYFVETWAIP